MNHGQQSSAKAGGGKKSVCGVSKEPRMFTKVFEIKYVLLERLLLSANLKKGYLRQTELEPLVGFRLSTTSSRSMVMVISECKKELIAFTKQLQKAVIVHI